MRPWQNSRKLEVAEDFHTRTRKFYEVCRTFILIPRTSVSSVRPCHNTRNICEFCNTSIPSPEISGSSSRLLYPYPESTNPTEHNLAKSFVRSCCLDIACALASRCHCSSSVCLARRVGTFPSFWRAGRHFYRSWIVHQCWCCTSTVRFCFPRVYCGP